MASRKRSRAISPDLESGFSPRSLFSNLERVPQRLKPDFRPVLTARLRFAEAVPLQNLRKPRNTPANWTVLQHAASLPTAHHPARELSNCLQPLSLPRCICA